MTGISLLIFISGISIGPTRQAKGFSELAFARFTTVDAQDRLMFPQPLFDAASTFMTSQMPCSIRSYTALADGRPKVLGYAHDINVYGYFPQEGH
ncbi:hypothetical protein CORC01_05977 [Colletotrichum orchidophilum]|uniref:Uncharacterized protein n=1 Tax=Colletotrichum orchidophilum TaxID=1209926 RepID=A0A1G4BBC1_9PEZI|nr:uncharacterized protein CORC01_05977 [Colletotrichum orchidophilum]OHE98711.1 hypothetical protein CORC01_05977 [Colletotrichum orchidophilum]